MNITTFQHAKEISNMAIRLMQEVSGFKVFAHQKSPKWESQLVAQVSHVRNYKMQMRMGIHSGGKQFVPSISLFWAQDLVWAGLSGPRCHISRFLETRWNFLTLWKICFQVNIAALMESTSEPMKIQISQTTQELLQELGGFKTEIRGQMQVPRIGQVQIYSHFFTF